MTINEINKASEFFKRGEELEAKETKATKEFMELLNHVWEHGIMNNGLMADGRGDNND